MHNETIGGGSKIIKGVDRESEGYRDNRRGWGLRELTGWIDNWREYEEVGRNRVTIGVNMKMLGGIKRQ